jgi:MFS family permease
VSPAVAAVAGQLADYRRLLGIRDYRLLWEAQVVSTYGDRLTQLALAALVYGITGSEVGLGIVLTVSELPHAVFGLFAGTVADRVSRKTLLIATDCVRALLVMVLALWVGVPLAVVYAVTALHAIATVFFTPTRYAVLPDMVPREKLLRVNTLDETTLGALDPIAYLLGGVVVATLGTRGAFGIDSLTFLLSAALIAATTPRAAPMWRVERAKGRSVRADTVEGVRLLFRDKILRSNLLLMVGATLIASAETPLVYMLVFSHWDRGTLGLGILEAGLALGFVLGAFVCTPVVERLGKGRTIIVGLFSTGLLMAVVAVLPFWPAVVANSLAGAFNILFFVPGITMAQQRAPRDARARVLSSRSAIMAMSIFASYATATYLTTRVAADTLLAAMGIALAGLALTAAALVPALRER